MLRLARVCSLSMRDIVKKQTNKKNLVCVIMLKRESLSGNDGGFIALQVWRRFPLVMNILFTRMQCDTSFGDAFQDKDKLSANTQISCDASISSYIGRCAHTRPVVQAAYAASFSAFIALAHLKLEKYDEENHKLDCFPSDYTLFVSYPQPHRSFHLLQVQAASSSL